MTSEIEEKKKYLLHWMYDFIEDDDEPAYLTKDVEEFDGIITAFINEFAGNDQSSNSQWAMTKIENLVKTLNEINLKHQHQLIEADQREDICQLISLVMKDAGHDYSQDITEQWRTW